LSGGSQRKNGDALVGKLGEEITIRRGEYQMRARSVAIELAVPLASGRGDRRLDM